MTDEEMNRDLRSLKFAHVLNVERDVDDTMIIYASHPELPGCLSHGSTPEEALAMLDDARILYLQSLIADGIPIPTPAPIRIPRVMVKMTVEVRSPDCPAESHVTVMGDAEPTGQALCMPRSTGVATAWASSTKTPTAC